MCSLRNQYIVFLSGLTCAQKAGCKTRLATACTSAFQTPDVHRKVESMSVASLGVGAAPAAQSSAPDWAETAR